MRARRSSLPDAEVVERVRCGIARYDRVRGWLIALYLGLAAALIGLAISVPEFIQKVAAGLGPGFAVGGAIGASIGLLAVHIAHGLVRALCGGSRPERLLVRYYDLVQEFEFEAEGDVEGDAESSAATGPVCPSR